MVSLQVGKKYRTRDGKHVVPITRTCTDDGYSFRGMLGDAENFWTHDGRYWARNYGLPDNYDLIEEIPGPFQLQVGKYYRTKSGKMAYVSALLNNPFHLSQHTHYYR